MRDDIRLTFFPCNLGGKHSIAVELIWPDPWNGGGSANHSETVMIIDTEKLDDFGYTSDISFPHVVEAGCNRVGNGRLLDNSRLTNFMKERILWIIDNRVGRWRTVVSRNLHPDYVYTTHFQFEDPETAIKFKFLFG